MSKKCVWVLEIGIYHATIPHLITSYDIWQAFNTRGEAVAERNKLGKTVKWRIVKYVPAS